MCQIYYDERESRHQEVSRDIEKVSHDIKEVSRDKPNKSHDCPFQTCISFSKTSISNSSEVTRSQKKYHELY